MEKGTLKKIKHSGFSDKSIKYKEKPKKDDIQKAYKIAKMLRKSDFYNYSCNSDDLSSIFDTLYWKAGKEKECYPGAIIKAMHKAGFKVKRIGRKAVFNIRESQPLNDIVIRLRMECIN